MPSNHKTCCYSVCFLTRKTALQSLLNYLDRGHLFWGIFLISDLLSGATLTCWTWTTLSKWKQVLLFYHIMPNVTRWLEAEVTHTSLKGLISTATGCTILQGYLRKTFVNCTDVGTNAAMDANAPKHKSLKLKLDLGDYGFLQCHLTFHIRSTYWGSQDSRTNLSLRHTYDPYSISSWLQPIVSTDGSTAVPPTVANLYMSLWAPLQKLHPVYEWLLGQNENTSGSLYRTHQFRGPQHHVQMRGC